MNWKAFLLGSERRVLCTLGAGAMVLLLLTGLLAPSFLAEKIDGLAKALESIFSLMATLIAYTLCGAGAVWCFKKAWNGGKKKEGK